MRRTAENPSPLSFLLRPLGHVYGLAMRLRASAYSQSLFRSWDPPVPCLSVGNISWGGTGKTPLTSWLAGEMLAMGRSPLILTRGYKARPLEYPHLVRPDDDPALAGDEPLLLAHLHPNVRVVVDPVRRRSGPWAMERFSPDVLLLDDGFQHLGVRRDLDIVLLTPGDLTHGWNRVLPAGTWREGVGALQRAHVLLINQTAVPGTDLGHLAHIVRTRLRAAGKPWFPFQALPVGLRSLSSGESVTLEPEHQYLLVTGIANPERVALSAEQLLGRPPAERFTYPDHHAYTAADVRAIREACDRLNGVAVTTAKDGVKLRRWSDNRILAMDLDLDFPSGDHGRFPEWLSTRLESLGLG
jgi:tetraacyldisaccharide 4'-kinase